MLLQENLLLFPSQQPCVKPLSLLELLKPKHCPAARFMSPNSLNCKLLAEFRQVFDTRITRYWTSSSQLVWASSHIHLPLPFVQAKYTSTTLLRVSRIPELQWNFATFCLWILIYQNIQYELVDLVILSKILSLSQVGKGNFSSSSIHILLLFTTKNLFKVIINIILFTNQLKMQVKKLYK